MTEILVEYPGRFRKIPVDPGLTIAQNLFVAGFFRGIPLCSGLGHCGLCRIRFLSVPLPRPDDVESKLFSTECLEEGWRLSCRHYPDPNTHIEVRQGAPVTPFSPSSISWEKVAIDIGTTTIKWQGTQRGQENKVHKGQCPNPQLGGGSDVMARMGLALHGYAMQDALQQAVLDWLRSFFCFVNLGEDAPEVVITGNAVMLYLLLGKPLTGLATAPYVLDYFFGEKVRIDPDVPTVYIPPLLSPFVGADISCGISHLKHLFGETIRYPFILADFGTNGEFVLALAADKFLVTSVAMGPALEGVGLSQGKMAGSGVCTSFSLTPAGILPGTGRINNGISGSGYLSLLALLHRTGVLLDDGRLRCGTTPLGRRIGRQIENDHGRSTLYLDGVNILTGQDIEEILKVKASCNYALEALFEHAGIKAHQITSVYLAGSLGEHFSSADLVELGFVPLSLQHKIHAVGNTSLAGAWDLLHDPEGKKNIKDLQKQVLSIALAGEIDFTTRFVHKMFFRYVQGH
ncbi:MAG: ASKHA domain-containing protein [Desulfoplanes sp.]